MAHATPTTLIVQRPVEVQGIALALTMEEAAFLSDLMGCIGGSPTRSRRAYADRIRVALSLLELPTAPRGEYGGAADIDRIRSGVYFTTGPEEIK